MNIATEDYLKTIYGITREGERAGTKEIADRLGISPASVTGFLQKLSAGDPPLVDYRKRGGAVLTTEGERRALKVIRSHRLLETFLHRVLGYSWDRVHDEACMLEHVISEEFELRISELLGNPTHDPHGDPIPDRNLSMPAGELRSLAQLPTGGEATVERVSDSDPELLRYLGDKGIVPGTVLRVLDRSPFDRNMRLRIRGRHRSVILGPVVTEQVFIREEE